MSTLPEPPWSSRKTARPARPAITREAITGAALRIVDAEGLEALSMRRLADQLGCQASALYGHVSGKSEVLQLLIDHVAGEIEVPDPDPERWQEQVKDVLRAIHRTFLAHRDLAGASLANIPTGPNAMRVVDRFLALLLAGGLSRQAAAYAADLLPQFVTASAYEFSLFEQRVEREPDYFERLEEYYRALPADRFPVLADLVGELMAPDEEPTARFEFGLDVILRGLAALAEPS
ncbi:MAG TPA: TetR/AcrR family transcriptional regulator C-terminal domain-containing protein [Gaiellaceae bacterium]|nr:TetR/AcrR family transcriptional regulator C-terminal domain-containing protein [Gaiellaceae bacterium]